MEGRTPRSSPGERPALSRQRVVERALALADAEGLQAVTIRRVAGELGVTPMALYWHFENKNELLSAMAEQIFALIALPDDGPEPAAWQDRLARVLEATTRVLRAHPATAPLLPEIDRWSEHALQVVETTLGILRSSGFSPTEASQVMEHAFYAVVNLVVGEAGIVPQDPTKDRRESERRLRRHLESLPPDRYPHIIEAALPLSTCIDPESYYRFGLEMVLAGVEAMARRSPRA
jgi:TetR/AcrR family tetracycline transcriptional repressor